ncbi:hypothetical protein P879_10827 [Paragonimus westermani]|uniref:Uncharacterized protein n=1 Tax=Paragonimus westermani TaxID=34504 RepID=A0A8T0DLJ3_9TREM|nr:hypothetical protein P879_10827 [Paragonimus westermani]
MPLAGGQSNSYTESQAILRLRYLQILKSLIGRNRPVLLHLAELPEPVRATLESWCPCDLLYGSQPVPDLHGAVCVQNLHTPLGVLSKARIRDADLVALDISFS